MTAAQTVSAEESVPANTIDLAIGSGDLDEGEGNLSSTDTVLRLGFDRTFGPCDSSSWLFYDPEKSNLNNPGPYNYGNRFESTITCSTQLWGAIDVEGSAGIWYLPDFSRLTGSILPAYIQTGHTFSLDDTDVRTYVRLTEWIGLGAHTTATIARPGIEVTKTVDFPAIGSICLDVHVLHSFFFAQKEGSLQYPYYDSSQAFVEVTKELGNGFTGYVDANFSTQVHTTYFVGMRYGW
ncbi:MAG TPA: hypothetical protein VHB93_01290 [Candidatus Paceibacterota bacterium]|nr:hypothetical protein [Candidatus Paceibacterota bacterium]